MAKVEVVVKEKGETPPAPLAEVTRKAVLAGMGALSLAREQANALFDRLVERGEGVQRDSRRMVRDVMGQRQGRRERARAEFEKRVEQVAGSMNLPTRSDLDDLSTQISSLTQKIDELRKEE